MGQLRQISRRAYRLSDRYGRSRTICSLPATAATRSISSAFGTRAAPSALDMYLFSEGEYVKSLEQRTMSEVITKVLYPADDHIEESAPKAAVFLPLGNGAVDHKDAYKALRRYKKLLKAPQDPDKRYASCARHSRAYAHHDGRVRPRLGRGVGSGEPIGCLRTAPIARRSTDRADAFYRACGRYCATSTLYPSSVTAKRSARTL